MQTQPIEQKIVRQPSHQVIRDFKLGEDVGKTADAAENLSNHSIGSTKRGVDLRPDADQTSRYREHEVVLKYQSES
jgi:hypothetical protein